MLRSFHFIWRTTKFDPLDGEGPLQWLNHLSKRGMGKFIDSLCTLNINPGQLYRVENSRNLICESENKFYCADEKHTWWLYYSSVVTFTSSLPNFQCLDIENIWSVRTVCFTYWILPNQITTQLHCKYPTLESTWIVKDRNTKNDTQRGQTREVHATYKATGILK